MDFKIGVYKVETDYEKKDYFLLTSINEGVALTGEYKGRFFKQINFSIYKDIVEYEIDESTQKELIRFFKELNYFNNLKLKKIYEYLQDESTIFKIKDDFLVRTSNIIRISDISYYEVIKKNRIRVLLNAGIYFILNIENEEILRDKMINEKEEI